MFAQDIIILKNGNDIQAIVKEVGIDDVKYKRFDNQNGPNYTLKKSDIFMIRYENGSKDVFNEIVTPAPVNVQQQAAVNQQINPYNNNTNSEQQLPVLKYTFGNQINPYGSEKSPFLAGFLSFLIPGVGQFYNGDVGGGFLFLGCNIVCNSIWMSSISTDYYGNTYIDGSTFTVGFIGALVVNISSIVNASKMAKKVNMARGYCLGENTYLKVQPTILQQNNAFASKELAYGMNFCLNF
jgi:TM2 domain-containing membrane protein YozV